MELFAQTFVATANTDKTTTVFVSLVAQTIVAIIAILLPMIYFDALPTAQLQSLLIAPPAPPAPTPRSEPVSKVVKMIARQFDAGQLMAPKAIPNGIAIIKESELPPSSAVGAAVATVNPGVLSDILRSVPVAAPPPPAPTEIRPAPPAHVRIGGLVQSAKLVRQPKPVYPELAKRARIQGVVKLHALISKEGIIEDLRVVGGHPLLVPSALEAVRQWIYRPTLLNGEPVGVETDIDVNFALQ